MNCGELTPPNTEILMQIRSFARSSALALVFFAGTALAQAPAAPAKPAAPAQPAAPTQPAVPAKPATPAPAADKLPEAKEILAKFIKASGGVEAMEKFKTRVTEGTMEMKPMGLKAKFKLNQSSPAMMKMLMEIEGMGTVEQGTDGTQAWEDNPMSGPRLLTGDELDEAKRQADIMAEAHPEKTYSEMKTLGVEKVGDAECYAVELKTKSGNARTHYYDKTSGLLVRMKLKAKNQMGEFETDSIITDYREVDGVKLPFSTTVKIPVGPGIEQILKIEKITHNSELPKDAFKPSADVQELIDKDAKKGTDAKDPAPGAAEPTKDAPKKDEPKK